MRGWSRVDVVVVGAGAAGFAATKTARALGLDVLRFQINAVSRWAREPNIRGAYAAAVPGLADRRADLARPIADRLFFAGAATSPATTIKNDISH